MLTSNSDTQIRRLALSTAPVEREILQSLLKAERNLCTEDKRNLVRHLPVAGGMNTQMWTKATAVKTHSPEAVLT